jgi:hypothetical protein
MAGLSKQQVEEYRKYLEETAAAVDDPIDAYRD